MALFVPTTNTIPEEYRPDMAYPAMNTTITQSNGTDIPNIQIEDDLRHTNAANKAPAELHQGATWTGFTDFNVRPVHCHTATLPIFPETKDHRVYRRGNARGLRFNIGIVY